MPDNTQSLGRNLPSGLPDIVSRPWPISNPYANVFKDNEPDPLRAASVPILAWDLMQTRWCKIEALLGGTQRMRELDQTFLPQEPSESDAAYDNRRCRSVLFNMFENTADNMTGRPFAKPVDMADYPSDMMTLAENIDLQGNNLDVFLPPLFKNALTFGHAAIMVDYPKNTLRENTTLQDEREQNLRPYWVVVEGQRIIGWRAVSVNGVFTLTQVRMRETAQRDVGKWGVEEVQRVRVLYQGFFELYELDNRTGRWFLEDSGQFIDAKGNPFLRVPMVLINFKATSFMTSLPPLDNIADLNISHWQAYSDLQNIIHVAQVPLLYGSGFDEDQSFVIGVSRAITGPQGSDLKYVEITGNAIKEGRQNVQDIENRVALLGAQVLAKKPSQMTATQSIIDVSSEVSDLQAMVITLEDGVDLAFQLTAEWQGNDPETSTGKVDIYKDFGISGADAQELTVLTTARAQRQITQSTLLEEYKRRGVLMDNLDVDEEIRKTQAETPNMQDLVEDDSDIDTEEEV